MGNKIFYEKYWSRSGGSPAEFGFALEERKTLLRNAILALPKDQKVMDVGCGNGDFVEYLHELGFQAVGVDISIRALRKAQSLRTSGSYVGASLEEGLPFANNSFGAIYCSEVLEHIFSVHSALSELNRILLFDGLLILTVPYHGVAKNMAIALFGFERHYDPNISHIRFFTRKSLASSLYRSGFKVVAFKGIGRWFPFWMSLCVVAKKVSQAGPEPEIVG
jgi:ubiquinone/menaquinone biosynthesis C-methylase UbiE